MNVKIRFIKDFNCVGERIVESSKLAEASIIIFEGDMYLFSSVFGPNAYNYINANPPVKLEDLLP